MEMLGTGGETVRQTIVRPVSPTRTRTGGETIVRPVSPRGTRTGPETAGPVSPRGRPTRAGKTPRRGERATGHRHRAAKSSRLPETPGRTETKQGQKEDEGTAEDKEERTGRCTVVDVDSVRQKAEEDRDELHGLLETNAPEEGLKQRGLGVCEWLLMVAVLSLVLLFLPLSIWFCVQVVREHERAVIFRLGHLLRGRPRGPGLLFYLPFLDVCQKVDIRLKMLKVPPHTVMTKDLLSAEVSAACYYRVDNVLLCATSVSDVGELLQAAVRQAVRAALSAHSFTHVLVHRTDVGRQVRTAADALVCPWGVRVERTEIEDVCLPAELQLSLSAEAEAKRQAHVKVIMAEGERAACQALQSSLDLMSSASPAAAVHLRLLQHLLSSRPSELLPLTPDLLPLPFPPPPPPEAVEGEALDTDSPMM